MKRLAFGLAIAAIIAAAVAGVVFWRAGAGADPAALEQEYMTAADRFVDVGGLRVRVREEGPESVPPVILLHGFIYSLETWDAWVDVLAEDYRIIRFDMAGHGLTGPDPQERYSPKERAAFIGEVMDALGIEEAVIGGNSLGGLAAWRFAALAPERVSGLILVSPGAYSVNGVADEPVAAPEPLKLFLRTAPQSGVEIALQRIFEHDSAVTPALVERVGDMMRREGNGEAFVQALEEFTLPDPEAELARIEAPTLILWGEKDALIPVEQGRRMAEIMPNAELIVYEGVGHVAQEEAAEQSARDAKEFLDSLEP